MYKGISKKNVSCQKQWRSEQVPEKKEKEKGSEKIFGEIIIKNYPNIGQ